jgi:hypothetical protein
LVGFLSQACAPCIHRPLPLRIFPSKMLACACRALDFDTAIARHHLLRSSRFSRQRPSSLPTRCSSPLWHSMLARTPSRLAGPRWKQSSATRRRGRKSPWLLRTSCPTFGRGPTPRRSTARSPRSIAASSLALPRLLQSLPRRWCLALPHPTSSLNVTTTASTASTNCAPRPHNSALIFQSPAIDPCSFPFQPRFLPVLPASACFPSLSLDNTPMLTLPYPGLYRPAWQRAQVRGLPRVDGHRLPRGDENQTTQSNSCENLNLF